LAHPGDWLIIGKTNKYTNLPMQNVNLRRVGPVRARQSAIIR